MGYSEAMMAVNNDRALHVGASSHADGALNAFGFDGIVERGLSIVGLWMLGILQLVIQGLSIG